ASYVHLNGDDFTTATFNDENGNPIVVRDLAFTDGHSGEAQYIFRTEGFSSVAGVGYYNSGFAFSDTPDRPIRTSHGNGYLYSYVLYPQDFTWILGLSFDSLNDDLVGNIEQLNPKLGLVWRATLNTTI